MWEMNKGLYNGIICILVIVIAGLALMLYQNQQTIKQQQATIASQQQKISELEGRVKELEAITPESLLNDAKSLLKDQGASFLNNFIQRVQE